MRRCANTGSSVPQHLRPHSCRKLDTRGQRKSPSNRFEVLRPEDRVASASSYLPWRYEEAEDNLKKAVEKQPKDSTIYDHLAEVYFKQEKTKDAISSWEKSVKAYENAGLAEREGVDIAAIQKKLEKAKNRLANNNTQGSKKEKNRD